MDIIIHIENVSQNFHPEPVSLKHLMAVVRSLYERAIYPARLDGEVRLTFAPANKFEFNYETEKVTPTEQVYVTVFPERIHGIRPPTIIDFKDPAERIIWPINVFLGNTSNGYLNLPAAITIGTGSKSYAF